MRRTRKEIRKTTWMWVIGVLIVLGLIWWWAAASIDDEEEMPEHEEREVEEVESSLLQEARKDTPDILLLPDFSQV